MNKILLVLICVLTTIVACNYIKVPDDVVNKYDGESFDELKGVFLAYRGSDRKESIVMIDKYEVDCFPYFVSVDRKTKDIIKISNERVLTDCEDYMSDSEIIKYVKQFVKYNVMVLGVDADGNVFMNPAQQERPNLIRINPEAPTNDTIGFKHFKGNWYYKE